MNERNPSLSQEAPKKENPQENNEAMNERIEALQGIVQEYYQNVKKAVDAHLANNRVIYSTEGGYDDDLKRKSLLELNSVLSAFMQQVNSTWKVLEENNEEYKNHPALPILMSHIRQVQERLAAAPDMRYSWQAKVEKYGGDEKQVPGGKGRDTWEYTEEYLQALNDQILGIGIGLKFLDPSFDALG